MIRGWRQRGGPRPCGSNPGSPGQLGPERPRRLPGVQDSHLHAAPDVFVEHRQHRAIAAARPAHSAPHAGPGPVVLDHQLLQVGGRDPDAALGVHAPARPPLRSALAPPTSASGTAAAGERSPLPARNRPVAWSLPGPEPAPRRRTWPSSTTARAPARSVGGPRRLAARRTSRSGSSPSALLAARPQLFQAACRGQHPALERSRGGVEVLGRPAQRTAQAAPSARPGSPPVRAAAAPAR